MGLQMAADEEMYYQRQRQKDPNYQRQLIGWIYEDGMAPIPRNPKEYERAYNIANSLKKEDLNKIARGGYGGERGNAPSGEKAVELAADTIYNASYGIDVLTGAPLNYKNNAGHVQAFANYGQGVTRPEQSRVNKALQEFEGMKKLLLAEKTIDDVNTAKLFAQYPEEMTALLNELPSSNRETSGWNPELKEMQKNAKRWQML